MKIVFATKNKGKLQEINQIMSDMNVTVLSMADLNIDIDVVEDGETFFDNAKLKAIAIMKETNLLTLADDSGIEIDAFDKKPGVHSARYMGENTPYEVKNAKILKMLENVPWEKRTARFISVIAAAFPDGTVLSSKGTIEGYIGYEIKGKNGFGYDPIFYVPEYNMTTSEMDMELKNQISHRGKALAQMKEQLKNFINEIS